MLVNQFKLSKLAFEGLQKLNRNKKKNALQELTEKRSQSIDYSKHIFEDYSDDFFKEKINVDKYIYNIFFEGLNEEQTQDISNILGNMLKTVRQIYEFINIKPKKYGFQRLDTTATEDDLLNESRDLIKSYLNKKYYSLTKENREKLYKSEVINLAKDLVIEEDLDVNESIEHSYKSIVIDGFIKKLNFPFMVESKIDELLKSETYKQLSEQDELKHLWDDFSEQRLNISRVIAMSI